MHLNAGEDSRYEENPGDCVGGADVLDLRRHRAWAELTYMERFVHGYAGRRGHLVYPFTMVGGDPSSTGTTTVTTYLIPFKLVFQASDQSQACGSAPVTFDPYKVLSNGQAVVDNVISSPIFTPVPFSQGSGDTLQYIDAFQRANFWGVVQGNTSYHLKLGPLPVTVLQTPPLVIPAANGSAKDETGTLGGCMGIVYDWGWFVGQILIAMSSLSQVQPNTLPIFLTDDVFLTPINGGFHLATGTSNPQTYIWATYNDGSCPGGFNGLCVAQDVADLSHEVAEWADDPFGRTSSPCPSYPLLEVGDPLLGQQHYYSYSGANNGFSYHLQDLVMLPFFEAQTGTS